MHVSATKPRPPISVHLTATCTGQSSHPPTGSRLGFWVGLWQENNTSLPCAPCALLNRDINKASHTHTFQYTFELHKQTHEVHFMWGSFSKCKCKHWGASTYRASPFIKPGAASRVGLQQVDDAFIKATPTWSGEIKLSGNPNNRAHRARALSLFYW